MRILHHVLVVMKPLEVWQIRWSSIESDTIIMHIDFAPATYSNESRQVVGDILTWALIEL